MDYVENELDAIDLVRAVKAMGVITANENSMWFTRTSIGQMEKGTRERVVSQNKRNAEDYVKGGIRQAVKAQDLAKLFAGINDG